VVSVFGNNRTIHIKDNHSEISYNFNGRLACISVSMLVSEWMDRSRGQSQMPWPTSHT